MSLELVNIEAAGDLASERIVLRANNSTPQTEIGWYAVFRCWTATKEGMQAVLAGPVPNVYWFASKKVKPGDWVVLYSKAGTLSEKVGQAGVTSHFYYWGMRSPLWIPGFTPALVETPNWFMGRPILAPQAASGPGQGMFSGRS